MILRSNVIWVLVNCWALRIWPTVMQVIGPWWSDRIQRVGSRGRIPQCPQPWGDPWRPWKFRQWHWLPLFLSKSKNIPQFKLFFLFHLRGCQLMKSPKPFWLCMLCWCGIQWVLCWAFDGYCWVFDALLWGSIIFLSTQFRFPLHTNDFPPFGAYHISDTPKWAWNPNER